MTKMPKKNEAHEAGVVVDVHDDDDEDDVSSCTSGEELMDDETVEMQCENMNDEGKEEEEEDSEDGDSDSDDSDGGEDDPKVFIPGKTSLDKDEELVMDHSAYLVYHQVTTIAPCLSFSIVKDKHGDNRADVFPLTAYMVAGTQAEPHEQNNILCMKLWNMHGIDQYKDNEEDSDDEELPEQDTTTMQDKRPKLNVAYVPHAGAINRVRVQELSGGRQICASWSENGSVYLTDITEALGATEKSELLSQYVKNKLAPKSFFKFSGHKKEGFGLDWSPIIEGQLASGDCYKNLHVWKLSDGGHWKVDERPLVGHSASVEDIQWSPNEASVLASCSVDKSIRIFDIRANPAKSCMLTAEDAHTADVNVISWNRMEQAFLLSGGDDGMIKVWDLRQFKTNKPVTQFEHHKAPITSIEWHPTDSTVFTACSEDDCITLWDLAVERDEAGEGEGLDDLPPQLLFIHQGQQELKECHWHPQMPGVLMSTAQSGFNIFRTISV